MSRVNAYPMTHIREFINPKEVYVKLMNIMISLAENGLIHGDFNEFNLMIDDEENLTLIDFPQMISIDHPDANFFFNRDVECIQKYFGKKCELVFPEKPTLSTDVERKGDIDKEVKESVWMREAVGEDGIQGLDLVEANMDNEGEGEGDQEVEGEEENNKQEEDKQQEEDEFEPVEGEQQQEAEGNHEQEVEGEIDDTGRFFITFP
jgi:RIO kinase 2